MEYKMFVYDYEYGWELLKITSKLKEIDNIIENIDYEEYGQYIVMETSKNKSRIINSSLNPKIKTKGGKK